MLVSIEGLDASGKTTLLNALCDKLKQNHNIFVFNRKVLKIDDTTFFGHRLNLMQELLFSCNPEDDLTEIPESTWVYLNVAWYEIISNKIITPNVNNMICITDSWIYKRISRFSLLSCFNDYEVEWLYRNVYKADYTFFINANPEQVWPRREIHSKKDFGFLNNDFNYCTKENFINYQTKIYNNYIEYVKKYKWIIINPHDSVDISCRVIIDHILNNDVC